MTHLLFKIHLLKLYQILFFQLTHPRCICTECDFMAEHAYMIKRHMMRHTTLGCKCEVCGRIYKVNITANSAFHS